ncbi:hypothetical protein EDD86DRAFT_273454 [Gorgonomyces haynaldii]|nr:hypothetical protein EDD86DRAFT_273454 [Gorgonomyces haynaldii]
MDIDPAIIYFTHSKIRNRFSGCGKLLQETLEEILNGTTTVAQIPKIRVIYDQETDRYYSLNNRRLWLFKQLKQLGKLDTILVELRRPETKQEARLGKQTLSLNAKPCLK